MVGVKYGESRMSFRLVSEHWGTELENALRRDRSELRIVSPFIKHRALQRLLAHRPEHVRVVTRFDLNDFASCVSDVDALRTLLECRAAVRGVRALHAKLYVFGDSVAVVTSANLTVAGLDTNPEFGTVTEDPAAVRCCRAYFDELWHRARDDLRLAQVDRWSADLARYLATGAGRAGSRSLPDHGVDAGQPAPSRVLTPSVFTDADRAIVKFHGRGDARAKPSRTTIQEVAGSGCHWAVCYPHYKRPTSLREGTTVFIACLTAEEARSRVFGRAVGIAYQGHRDVATPADIERRPWKAEYPHYIRVHHAEFVAGELRDAVSLEDMMEDLGTDAFVTTQERANRGETDINVRLSVRRQAYARLTPQGRDWLNERLEAAFDTHGKIPRSTLSALDWPDLPEDLAAPEVS